MLNTLGCPGRFQDADNLWCLPKIKGMHIHQLNVSHHERQDRLLLRLNTAAGEEYRFWLTRRLTLRLLPTLEQTLARLESHQPHMVATDPASQQILTELKRDAFLKEADFKTPYAEQAQKWPLGQEPMLVTDVQIQLQGAGVLLTLEDKGGTERKALTQVKSCQLNLHLTLVHGLIHLIRQAMTQAEWLTAWLSAAMPDEPAQPAAPPETGYRH